MLAERERESDFSGGGVGGWRFLDNKMRSDGGVVEVSVFLYFFFITFVLRQLF